ncbi:MAG: hypothetical protein Q8S21_04475 [Candidatus Paracaedibacteraceae bacterium]|nr:hypothetical protein [Candidatus Paracaedibacteraceae bacterium]
MVESYWHLVNNYIPSIMYIFLASLFYAPQLLATEQKPLLCTSVIFQIIELKMNRTITVIAPLGTAIKHQTLLIQPQSCVTNAYASAHTNTTTYTLVWTLPYRVLTEPHLTETFKTPTLAFSGIMSTISPTFQHPKYAIIPIGCKTERCPANTYPPRTAPTPLSSVQVAQPARHA